MSDHPKSSATTFEINLKSVLCLAFGLGAYYSWPTHPQWWQAGILSFILGCASFAMLIDAFRAMKAKQDFDRSVNAIRSKADQPQSAELASDDTLENSGVFND